MERAELFVDMVIDVSKNNLNLEWLERHGIKVGPYLEFIMIDPEEYAVYKTYKFQRLVWG